MLVASEVCWAFKEIQVFLYVISEPYIQSSVLGRCLAPNYLEQFWVDPESLFLALKGQGGQLFDRS